MKRGRIKTKSPSLFSVLVKDVSKEYQDQGADYETYRSVLKVREDCRISRNAEIGALLRHLLSTPELTI